MAIDSTLEMRMNRWFFRLSAISLAVLSLVMVVVVFGCKSPQRPLVYPDTKEVDQVDNLFGVEVADPYRWLEKLDSPETAAWVEEQNKVTFAYLADIPGREKIRERLTHLWDFERYGVPFKEGGRYFFSMNTGLQNQSILYVLDKLDGQPRMLLDPNTLSADGTVALAGLSISEDGRYLAYGLATAGSDWNEFKVRDVATGQDLSDHLKWIKFSGASWTKDCRGFFYSRFDEPTGEKLEDVNYFQKLYYHQIGQPQSEDRLVYQRPDQKEWGFSGNVTEDGKYLIITVTQGSDRRNRVFYQDLAASDGKTVELIKEADAQYAFVGNDGPVFWFFSDLDAPRGRVIAIDTREAPTDQRSVPQEGQTDQRSVPQEGQTDQRSVPQEGQTDQRSVPQSLDWKELIPQAAETLQGVGVVNDMFVASYLKDAHSLIRIFDLAGKPVRDVALPGIGSAGGFGGKRGDKETFYAYTSFSVPSTVYRYDLVTGQSTVFRQPKVDFDPDLYVTRQVFYNSKDGTRIPMFITHKKGIQLDGTNPTLLYGYGGFDVSLTPSFSISRLVWMELGGVYAVANLRGGGEYGKEWHDAGRLANKQNVFDDFLAAAEWLIANKYTQPKKLAISGASNGGLLVGACMIQRPELFGAALPDVGVMDMLRFHKFTIGWAWTSDYGSPDKEDDFKVLHAYSPLHNIHPGTCYPATLVTTADHDDRVVPCHSFKFISALQAAQSGANPVLIRIETKAGHGGGKPTAKIIEQVTDSYAFLTRVLGMDVRKLRTEDAKR
jgi:prolyl oligopeptidase